MVSLLAAGGVTARAQEASVPDKSGYNLLAPTPDPFLRELSADRPDKTDCPFTVDAGHAQVEMDFANLTRDAARSQNGNVKSEQYQIAPMNLKVGVLNTVDVQLVLSPWRWERTENKGAGTVERTSGFGDITPRVKVNLMGNDGGFAALALIPFVKLPTGQPGNGAVEGGLGIPYAFEIPGWDVGCQTTIQFNRNEAGGGYHTAFDNSVSIGHALIGRLSVAAEFFSSVSTERGAGWIGTADTWLTFQVNKSLRLDAGAYVGVTPAADDLHLWLGLVRRF
jgi:hypothetical protein